jgi:hypothetical protein
MSLCDDELQRERQEQMTRDASREDKISQRGMEGIAALRQANCAIAPRLWTKK